MNSNIFVCLAVMCVVMTSLVSSEKIHACVPGDSCGGNQITGIELEYNCVCNKGWTGDFCDEKSNLTRNQLRIRNRRGSSTWAKVTPPFYCEDIETKCVNGVTAVTKKTAKC